MAGTGQLHSNPVYIHVHGIIKVYRHATIIENSGWTILALAIKNLIASLAMHANK